MSERSLPSLPSARVSLSWIAWLPWLALWMGCAAPPRARVNEAHTRAPEWERASLSWEKLEQVERWLESPAADVAPYWRVEGQLVLAEGRVQFSQRDLASAAVDPSILDARLGLARVGFDLVLRDPDASRSQEDRARRGLDSTRNLEGRLTEAGSTAGPNGIIRRAAWGAAPGVRSRLDLASVPYRRITVHHSAMPDPPRFDGSVSVAASEVRRIQRSQLRGGEFGDIAYHFLIDPSGLVFEGRELRFQGAHAKGSNNVGNIGICLLGNFNNERPTPAALAALERLVEELQNTYSIPRHAVEPHATYGGTECPGDHLEPWVRNRW